MTKIRKSLSPRKRRSDSLNNEKKPFLEHLEELRLRVIYSLLFFILIFIGLFFFSPHILNLISKDFMDGTFVIISLNPTEVILSELRISFFLALILSLPVFIYHFLRFVKPAMTNKEKSFASAFIFISPLLFLLGIWFAYSFVLRFVIRFLSRVSLLAVQNNFWSLREFISFILTFSFSFGLIFQLPLVMFVLRLLNIVNKEAFVRYRPFVYVLIFVLAAIITPPDVVTQILLAIPLVLLYELSLLMLKLFNL